MLKKIAVVDDSELLHRMYALTLLRYRNAGTVILGARDGVQLLQLLREHDDVDLVLLDVNMPKMTGIEVLARLRASRQLESMRVIMVSTEGREAEVKKALELGASDYVTKPFSPNDLHARITRLFPDDAEAGEGRV